MIVSAWELGYQRRGNAPGRYDMSECCLRPNLDITNILIGMYLFNLFEQPIVTN